MGAIIAYKGTTFVDSERRQGMWDLGQAIQSNMVGAPTRDKLFDALSLIVDAATGSPLVPTYTVRYEFSEKSGGSLTPKTLTIKKVKKGKKDDLILCRLDDGSGQKGVLRLKFENDSREEEFSSTNYFMTISFPDTDDYSNLAYLDAPTNDIRYNAGIAPAVADVANAKQYLAAFKFLSRCK